MYVVLKEGIVNSYVAVYTLLPYNLPRQDLVAPDTFLL
ncbi:hypothetical protein P186_1679 [Pyrobaculum ferrireducens]|uniref:Uncharacterized protein n=1 Tax=Pyrobaculum ferrireducens TaxID=1104324 RepID=G7VGJ3_9CREN|nr:hypothetical protein P186_1679 [Pyrobaculum ferrireducens]